MSVKADDGRRSKLTDSDLKRISDLYAGGLTIAQVAERSSIGRWAVTSALNRSGVEIRTPHGYPSKSKLPDSIVQEYEAGMSTMALGRKYGVTYGAIIYRMRRLGADVRDPYHRQRYKHNKRAFIRINPASAYWAGFLLADGCVRPHGKSFLIYLSLAEADGAHVEAFRNFLCSDYPVQRGKAKGGLASPSRFCRIKISSRQLGLSLIRLGVTPRKTATATAGVQVAGNRHFWRGMVDGDGSLGHSKKSGPVIQLAGSLNVVRQFAGFCCQIVGCKCGSLFRGRGIWTVRFCGRPALKIIGHIYRARDFSLARKGRRAADILSLWAAWGRSVPRIPSTVRKRPAIRRPSLRRESRADGKWAA